MSEVVDNRARHRFELEVEGETAFAEYRRERHEHASPTRSCREALDGRGIGSRLVHDALEQVRAEGLKVVPLCPFVEAYIDKHPEEQDLLA